MAYRKQEVYNFKWYHSIIFVNTLTWVIITYAYNCVYYLWMLKTELEKLHRKWTKLGVTLYLYKQWKQFLVKNTLVTVCKVAHSGLISTNCGLQTPLWSGVSNEGVLLLPFIVALAIAISFKACGISRLGANKQLEVKLSQLPIGGHSQLMQGLKRTNAVLKPLESLLIASFGWQISRKMAICP